MDRRRATATTFPVIREVLGDPGAKMALRDDARAFTCYEWPCGCFAESMGDAKSFVLNRCREHERRGGSERRIQRTN